MNEYDITEAFKKIENELIASMIRNMDRHRVEEIKEDKEWTMWQTKQLKALEEYKSRNKKKYGKEFGKINTMIGPLIEDAREHGNMDQEIKILESIKQGFHPKKGASDIIGEFFKLNDRKMDVLISATVSDVKKAETAILRRANDQYRKVIFDAQVYANSGAGTYEKAVDMATKDFLNAGIQCVEYANGARHTLADYADMAIRTAGKRAYLTGEGEKRKEWGISTVIMNKRGNPCPKCLPFVGKVLIDDVWSGGSSSGKSETTGLKYPLMSKAIAAGLYHPRCKDSHTTYFEGVSTPPDGKYTRDELDKIAKDYRQEQKEQYAKRQSEKFQRLSQYSLDKENKKKYSRLMNKWKDTSMTMDLSDDKMTNEDIYYLNQSKSFESYILNEKLRTMLPLTEEEHQIISGIDSAIMKLPDYEGTVYRSVGIPNMPDVELFEIQHQPNKYVIYPDYTSASLEVYDSDMEYQLIIKSKHGKNMVKYNPDEKEIIFKRETRFYITKREGNTIWMEEM